MGGGVDPKTSLVASEGEKTFLSWLWIKQFLTCTNYSLFFCNFRDTKFKHKNFKIVLQTGRVTL